MIPNIWNKNTANAQMFSIIQSPSQDAGVLSSSRVGIASQNQVEITEIIPLGLVLTEKRNSPALMRELGIVRKN